jgi:hypothetical protein
MLHDVRSLGVSLKHFVPVCVLARNESEKGHCHPVALVPVATCSCASLHLISSERNCLG